MNAALRCNLPGCSGPSSGVCINGLKVDECPDVISVPVEIEDQESIAKSPSDTLFETLDINTEGAASFDATKCDAFLRSVGGSLVGVVAGPEAGKTTLIATLYELVHRARMSRYGFAGSETLRGYEERCHLSRLASNVEVPDTPRTRRPAGLTFTHLRLQTPWGIRNVVFSDRSGELFDEALDTPGAFGNFAELRRADCILILVDLSKLTQSPHATKSYVRRIFLAMDQAGLLTGKLVRLVGTKADLLLDPSIHGIAVTALSALSVEFGNRSQGRIAVDSFITASRSKVGTTQIGNGLEDILDGVLLDAAMAEFKISASWPKKLSGFDELMRSFQGRQE